MIAIGAWAATDRWIDGLHRHCGVTRREFIWHDQTRLAAFAVVASSYKNFLCSSIHSLCMGVRVSYV